MAAKTSPHAPDTSGFDAAMVAFGGGEIALLDARKRLADLDRQADELGLQAAEFDRKRGVALARGEMADAATLGKQFAVAADAGREAHGQAEALRAALPVLEHELLVAEEAAQREHNSILSALYVEERSAAIEKLRPMMLRLFRLGIACGTATPWESWMRDVASDLDPGDAVFNLELADPLPLPEVAPQSALLGRLGQGFARRSEIREEHEKRQRAAMPKAA